MCILLGFWQECIFYIKIIKQGKCTIKKESMQWTIYSLLIIVWKLCVSEIINVLPENCIFLQRFRLINAVKPHTKKVSMLVMLPEMGLIITGSEDKSLFFFKFVTNESGINMDPIRCITLENAAINFQWLSQQVHWNYDLDRVFFSPHC
jgi:hypothetical protein